MLRKCKGLLLVCLVVAGLLGCSDYAIRSAAEQGDAKAQFTLGEMYDQGRGVEQDYAEAAKWYQKSAKQGNADAQYSLGWMYAVGRGVTRDDAEAVKWYRQAAEQGHTVAQVNLGMMYAEGRGVAQNDAEAAKWYAKVGEQEGEKQGDKNTNIEDILTALVAKATEQGGEDFQKALEAMKKTD